ncbi:Sphingosine N-acyltransferase lag1 [Neonectria magnoliae]|uniref:Sphingosine N-acyltransferase lag1 n=1 Tax=Neonectria magnoliae TaxID=2732573 RepID=A0ABR1IHW5_9HYPO
MAAASSRADDKVSPPTNDGAIGNAPATSTSAPTTPAAAAPKADATASGSGYANDNGTAKIKTSFVVAPRPRLKSGHSTPNMNGPLYKQSGNNVVFVRRLKRKEESTWKHLTRWFVENQIGLSFNLIALLFLAHSFIPRARIHTTKFFQLSYYNPLTGDYGIGFDDGYFIAFGIVAFTGLRAATMEYLLAPLAKLQGITKRKALTRFSEQAWLTVLYTVFWPLGMYIYYNSPQWLNMRELWTNWPNRELGGLMKGYLLVQWAFWLQQLVVIHIEDRRKDHWQMLTHHFVTTSLIWACYVYGHTRIGNFILIIMDVGDLILPLAKCLKYCGFQKTCDAMFGLFVISWFVARHVLYMTACWSVWKQLPEVLTLGCFKGNNEDMLGPVSPPPGIAYMFEPFFNTSGMVCHTETIKWAFLAPLLFLQVLTIIWFTMIVRVVIRVLKGGVSDDVRSDDEGEDEEEEDEFIYEEAQPLEEEVGVEDLDLRNWERRSGVRKQASSSGVSLPGHSDRKELLGRIGCEKQVD